VFAVFVFTTTIAAYDYDVFGGTGWAWSNWVNYDPIKFPRRESTLEESVSMRESALMGIRILRAEATDWALLYGLEINYLHSAPNVEGNWKYAERDANENTTYETRQANTNDSVPRVSALQFGPNIGFRRSQFSDFAVEGSLNFGIGYGTAKYRISYPSGSGGDNNIAGLAAQGSARLGVKYFISSTVALGLEGRALFESIDDNSLPQALAKSFSSNRNSAYNDRWVTTFGYFLLVSFTYRSQH